MIDFELFLQYVKKGLFTVEKHPNSELYIFGYQTGSISEGKIRKWDNISKKMRGLIVDSKGEIKSRSFEKFFTFRSYLSQQTVFLSDSQVVELPNCPYKIYEKIDGSLSILYWIDDTPYLATQRSFTSLKAKKATKILYEKYEDTFCNLKRDRTYIFEAIYPESKVLIDYQNEEKLILIGVLDNLTGNDLPLEEIGFPIAKDWTKKLENLTNLAEIEKLNIRDKEGFVLLYENGLRIKIKFPWYKDAHQILNKLIMLEYQQYKLESKLKEFFNYSKNLPSTDIIWKRFSNGENPKEILNDFPSIYNLIGVDEWIEMEYQKYKTKCTSENKAPVQPDRNKVLEINSLIYHPASENVMWKRISRLRETYD